VCGLAEQVVPASMLVALTHAGLWNTLHPDSHDVVLADDERMSDSNGAAYIQWLSDALGCALTSPLPTPRSSKSQHPPDSGYSEGVCLPPLVRRR